MKRLLFLFAFLAVGIITPLFGQVNDSEEPGSVLVFHKFVRGTTGPFAKTEIEISVTCPNGATCASSGQTVKLHAHWVCAGFLNFVPCSEVDFHLKTTVNGSIKFDPENFETLTNTDTVSQPPCDRGYLIAWVVDDSDNPIKFDGLIGDAVIRASNAFPMFDGFAFARAYNALPIQAGPALNTGDPTDLDSSGNHTGTLQFDSSGSHYQAVTGKIFGTVKYDSVAPAVQHTFLTLLTLDVQSNRFNNPTFVDLNFYNEKEVLKSASTHFTCWEEVAITNIDNTLTSTLFGNKGLVQSTSAQKQSVGVDDTEGPVTLVGIVETEQDTVYLSSWAYLLYNDSNPVPTTFFPNDSTTVTPPIW